eukprot:c25738_g1_i1.p1 GENE.c25738_g1_i1~~c25738_g1_i1.p1  ORF type:complete len:336 (+),score=-20.43 c25738_g1_i1:23-1009(+)
MEKGNIRDLRHASDAYLDKLSVNELKKAGNVVTVKTSDDVVKIYDTLQSNEISSVPVIDEKGGVVGTIDYLDLLCWMAETMPDTISIKMFMSNEQIASAGVSHVKAKFLIDNSGRDEYVPIYFDKLHTVITEFNKFHRLVGVNSDTGAPTMIVSQSMVVKYINTIINSDDANVSPLRAISKLTLAELYYVGEDKVVSIKSTDTLGDAIKLLAKEKIYGAPVVDATNGQLLFNFSASDLKQLYKHNDHTFNVFRKTMAEFMKIINAPAAVVVSPQQTIGDVMQTMVKNSNGHIIHRVYLVNAEKKPIRVVTMTDVLNVFIFSDNYPHHK